MREKIVRINQACEWSEPILCYVFINDWQLCPGQPCELSRACELVRVKSSRLFCTKFAWATAHRREKEHTSGIVHVLLHYHQNSAITVTLI